MPKLKIEQFVVGEVMTNCYFAINSETKQMIIIDPGGQADQLIAKIREEELKPEAILLTHGHFDHVLGVADVAKEFSIPVYAEEHEKETLENPSVNLSSMAGVRQAFHADVFVKDEQMLDIAGFSIRVLFTPGHTAGGCCYYFPQEMVVFTGDSLFCESIGRTDFPGGSASTLIHAVQDKLLKLPDFIKVYPGHNEQTTIGWERSNNPFL